MKILRLLAAIPRWIRRVFFPGERRCGWCLYCNAQDMLCGWCVKKKRLVNFKSDWCWRYFPAPTYDWLDNIIDEGEIEGEDRG